MLYNISRMMDSFSLLTVIEEFYRAKISLLNCQTSLALILPNSVSFEELSFHTHFGDYRLRGTPCFFIRIEDKYGNTHNDYTNGHENRHHQTSYHSDNNVPNYETISELNLA